MKQPKMPKCACGATCELFFWHNCWVCPVCLTRLIEQLETEVERLRKFDPAERYVPIEGKK